jgi:hypothetical protein
MLLANGFPTAKHEALRLSTFASRSMAAVTEDEKSALSRFPDHWKPPEPPNRAPDPRSLSALESSCRAAVTCDFAFQVEQAAAGALSFAARILWATHPSSSSFVAFSEAEARGLDSMALVKLGAVISFRPIEAEPERAAVRYGEVLQSDTIRRQWRVRLVGGGGDQAGDGGAAGAGAECVVSDFQLAGVEDTFARRCALACGPAPESSGDVEAATGASPSVGHLILALRWCQQAHAEIKIESPSSPSASSSAFPLAPPTVRRLAEVSSALLGTEVSLHRLVGSHPGRHQHPGGASSSAGLLAVQLRELFADESDALLLTAESAAVPAAAAARPAGGLGELVAGPAWAGVRAQLRPELLRAARDELELRRERQQAPAASPRHQHPHLRPFARAGGGGDYASAASSSSSPWVGAIRTRGDGRSPFRGIGI